MQMLSTTSLFFLASLRSVLSCHVTEHLCLVSTRTARSVPPGMTKQWQAAVKEKTDKPFHVAFQPEFLRAVSCEEYARAPWQVVFGYMEGEDDVKVRMSNAFLEFVRRCRSLLCFDESKLTVLNIAEAEIMKLVHK